MKNLNVFWGRRVMSVILVLCICSAAILNIVPNVSALMEDSYYKKTYGVTYNELLTKYPQYLNNQSFNYILNNIDDTVSSCVEGFAAPDDDFAAWVSGLKDGLMYYIPGYDDYVLRSVSEKTTKNLVNKMSGYSASPYDSQIKEVKELYYKPLANLDSAEKYIDKSVLMNDYFSGHKNMDFRMVEDYVNDIYDHENQLLSATGGGVKIYELAIIILAVEEVEYNTVVELYNAAPEHSTLKQGLAYHLENWEKTYVQNVSERYIKNKLIPKISSKIKEYGLKALLEHKDVTDTAMAFGELFWDIMIAGFEWSSAEDVMEATYSYSYAKSIDAALNAQRIKLCGGNASKSDIQTFETLWKAELAAYECALKDAEKITKNKTMKDICQTCLSYFDCDAISYETYIEWCMAALKKDVDAGNLVLDETPDEETLAKQSLQKIQTRFAEFQSMYPTGSHWYGSYGGGIQCYGFAKMCFAYIFGVDIPCYDWYGGKRYQFTNSDSVLAVGQLTGYSGATASDVKALFSKGKLGDVIQACGGGDSQHTMIFVAAHENGVEVYDCNVDNNCGIAQYTLSYQWIAENYCTNGTSLAGVTVYRAYNYAKLLGTTAFEIIDDSMNFIIDENGVLTQYTGYASVVVIPDEVTAIGNKAFQNNVNIRFVRMNDNVKSIGQYAFSGCKNLIEIDLPDSIVSIGTHAFYNCSSLLYADVPEPITAIEAYTWYGCSSIGSLTMSDNVVTVKNGAFENCKGLSSVKLSKSLETMEYRAFYDCDSLTSIEIPKSLKQCSHYSDIAYGPFALCSNLKTVTFERGTTHVAESLFASCDGLEEITLPNTITTVDRYAFKNCKNLKTVNLSENLTTIDYMAFMGCTSLVSIQLPEYLETIDGYVFANCSKLESIDIPDSVLTIKNSAFESCSALSSVKLSKSLETMGYRAFYDCDSLTSIEIPKSLKQCSYYGDIAYGPFALCSNLKTVTFERGATHVAEGLFASCDGLEEITLPNTITTVDRYAFKNCKNLKTVNFSENLTTIDYMAFMGCSGIVGIELPEYLETIDGYAFSNCSKLEAIAIPDSVLTIKNSAFENCTALSSVTLSKSLETMGWEAFYDCDSLTSIEIPKSLKKCDSLYDAAYGPFALCSNLKTVTFEKGTTHVAESLFASCDGLEEITLPNTITTVDQLAFKNCKNLKTVNFSENLTTIDYMAFMGCSKLQSAVIPDKVKTIGNYAFQDCSKLESVKMSDNVSVINAYTFKGCTSLAEINLPKSLTKIDSQAFYQCKSIAEVNVPEGVVSIGSQAFYDCEALETVNLPNGLASMGNECFRDCVLLENVTMGSGLKTIPTGAFRGTFVNDVTVPATVTKISDYAFAECVNLKKIIIPSSVTSISSASVFSYPKKMTIYGVKGTAAEAYAEEKSIAFVELGTTAIVNTEYNISVSSIDGGLRTDLTLNVTPQEITADMEEKTGNPLTAYRIALSDGAKEIQPGCRLKLTVPVPDGANGALIKVYRAAPNGTYSDTGAVLSNGMIGIEISDLGTFIIAESNALLGDINGDGKFTPKDLTILGKAYMAGTADQYAAIADMDGNGRITPKDITALGKLYMSSQ